MIATDVAPLRKPFDALAARLALIDEAKTGLDLQYYQWDSDNVGYLMLDRLIAAADRGVAVRLLVDDLRFRRRSHRAASLDLHPHLSVRLFNPWTLRSNMVTEALEFVMRFSKLDRRMHNKMLVADEARAIVGGRNIADAHYGLNEAFNLVDYDILMDGAGVAGLHEVFETYWTSPPATPVSAFDISVSPPDLEAVRTFVTGQIAKRGDAFPPDLTTDTSWRDRVAAETLPVPDGTLRRSRSISPDRLQKPVLPRSSRPYVPLSAVHARTWLW